METESRLEVTTALAGIEAGTHDPPRVADQILPAVYNELRRLAASYLRGERAGHTLEATALVHEAYLKLVDQDRVQWQGRTHFFAVAAQAMRRILVDHARKRLSEKRGGGAPRVTLGESLVGGVVDDNAIDLETVIDLDQALTKLADLDPREARLVELRFFAGCTVEEAAHQLGVSQRTAEAEWTHAKAWLSRELASHHPA